MSNFMKIRLFHANRRTYKTNLIVVFAILQTRLEMSTISQAAQNRGVHTSVQNRACLMSPFWRLEL
jgi:hypothetical protein